MVSVIIITIFVIVIIIIIIITLYSLHGYEYLLKVGYDGISVKIIDLTLKI